MEENNLQNQAENQSPNVPTITKNSQAPIAGAIVLAGILIAAAILLRGNTDPSGGIPASALATTTLEKVSAEDRTLGNPAAKITLVLYEDFQCPFCGKFFNDAEKMVRDTYMKNGDVKLVYRDFPFLGPESTQAAQAARCAGDQGKFWDYHDYLYSHQNGENQGAFGDLHLKSFAKTLSLDTVAFNKCLDEGTHAQAVADSKTEASAAGVTGTPKGFIVTSKNISDRNQRDILAVINTPPGSLPPVSFYTTKNIMSLDGALPSGMVKNILDILLK